MSLNSIGGNENLNEKKDTQEVEGKSFDLENYSENLTGLQKEVDENKNSQLEKASELKNLLNDVGEKERVENFIRENCSEPIENVNKIVPYKDLVDLVVKSAEEEFHRIESSGYDKESEEYKNAFEVRNKLRLFTLPDEEKNKLTDVEKEQMKGLAKDKRIYELPAYKNLIEKGGFIIPSDIRTSYDSAGQKPVQHLGVDYNVKAGTEVKSMYGGKVVASGLDGGLGYKVIIEHEMKDGAKFYSLYGHLGSKDLPKIGDKVAKGMKIGEVGAPFSEENGNWEEHLHFQIMESADSKEGYSDPEQGQIGNYDVLKSFGKGQ